MEWWHCWEGCPWCFLGTVVCVCAGWQLGEAEGSPWPCRAAPWAQVSLLRAGWALHGRSRALCAFTDTDKSTHPDLFCFPRWYLEMSQPCCSSPGWQIRGSLCLAGAGFRQRVSPAGRKHIADCEGTELSAVAVTRSRNAFSSEELVDIKNKAAMAYAPRNVWDLEKWKDIFLFLEQFAL